jgi:hypothetical protein
MSTELTNLLGAGLNLAVALADGKIVVDAADEDASVNLVLDNAAIRSATSGAIVVVAAEAVTIVLADGTENTVADGATSSAADPADDEPNAAIFSASDLTISGRGSLTVEGIYDDGIASKDGLVITGGTITASAVDDGIRGKDYLVVEDGVLTVQAQGIKAGVSVTIDGGTFAVDSADDAINSNDSLTINGGDFTLATGDDALHTAQA